MVRLISTFLTGAVFFVGVSCSSSDDGGSMSGENGQGSGTGGDNGGFGDSILFPSGDGGFVVGSNDFQACAAETVATESVPTDIYIMFDTSCSMSCPPEMTGEGLCCNDLQRPRINQVRDAVEQFLQAPDSTGIGVGIGYFGYLPAGNTSCDPADYAQPSVPIGALPGNVPNLVNSLNAQVPVGETPTGAAVRGACAYATQWKQQNPAHRTVILLVTDGYPEAPVSGFCNPTIDDAAQAASECLGANQINTYVLGVGGRLENLAQLAQAGGTNNAYLVDAGQDVTSGVLAALGSIRDAAVVPCDFTVPAAPDGEQLDPGLVNVTFKEANGDTTLIPPAGSAAGCDSGGWYYDDPIDPSLVRLCDSTCNEITAKLIAASIRGADARIDLKYGCGTVIVTR